MIFHDIAVGYGWFLVAFVIVAIVLIAREQTEGEIKE